MTAQAARLSLPGPISHLHLDPLGGMAGDMFVAALLDAFPDHAAAVADAATALSGVACRLEGYRDAVLTGARFDVAAPAAQHHIAAPAAQHRHDHDHNADHHHDHDHHDHPHTAWRDIRRLIAGSTVPPEVQRHATGIFTHLAEAEAQVHGVAVDDVAFHEVGNADSIADIVAAAWLIAAFPNATWSVGPIPLGSGRVRTAHGMLPVPAPATALLLQGLPTIDDGIPGERVTPTGAAILRHLAPAPRQGLRGSIARTGIGFGTRVLPGMSNVVRVLAFTAPHDDAVQGQHRELAVIAFEVDDQSPEDLAAGLDRLRALAGVHDVLQMPAFGKKGRMTVHVQVLARPDAAEAAMEACFRETTTIGLRLHAVQGRALKRRMHDVQVAGATLRVKSVDRPGGRTSKAEADDVLAHAGHATRARLRRTAERIADEVDDA
ncbi:MAG: LarC family nickel insertion protein [Acetobacteraceae bacterium]|nr:LarC family nickel insertion protein [Acetobacteraceae bacterium]